VSGDQFTVCCKEDSLSPKQISKQLTKKWPEVKEELDFLAKNLSKTRLVRAITILSDARKYRFLRKRTPKYGSMCKAFREDELERFFSVIDDPKLHLLFSFQATMGLRIGEAVHINIKDINLRTRELRIFTEKSKKTDFLLIPIQFFDRVIRYIESYEKEIAAARGFLFFSFTPGRRTLDTEHHLTTHSARDFFRRYLKKAKLEEVYGFTAGAKARALYRLTPHSLRHYAITNFVRRNGGNAVLASRFARHSNLQTTMVYIHTDKNELYEGIERAQDNELLDRIRKVQEKI
jgi:integrase